MSLFLINMIVFLVLGAYPPVESGLKFNHTKHFVENSINCADCHSVATSESSADKNITGHDYCGDCHPVEKAPDDCALCHLDPDNPVGVTMPGQEIIFSHKAHIKSQPGSEICLSCHPGVDKSVSRLTNENFPAMENCFRCHDGLGASAECSSCHSKSQEMTALIHDPGWKHEHRYATDLGGAKCAPCHQTETFCSKCHLGDNLVETVHELNYRYSHSIDAKGNEFQCQSCHDPQTFCSDCHTREGAKPLDHTTAAWALPPYTHADAAEQDIETCAACHSTDSPVCSRCHFDTDGVIGTNPPIHQASLDDLGQGPWHDDPGFQCFRCHVDTRTAGIGFCGYCHGAQD